jgi:hypothetical protein
MKNCQIKIEEYTYNVFVKPKRDKKSAFSFKNELRIVVWKNESPCDHFDMFQSTNNEWNSWTCNTCSETKITLRLKLQEYLNKDS